MSLWPVIRGGGYNDGGTRTRRIGYRIRRNSKMKSGYCGFRFVVRDKK